MAAIIVFTLNTLLRAGERYGAVSYQQLVLRALGKAVQIDGADRPYQIHAESAWNRALETEI